MGRKIYLYVAIILSLSLAVHPSFADVKSKYKGKLSPKNVQLNVQQEQKAANADRLEYSAAERERVLPIARYAVYSTTYEAELEEDIATIKGTANFEVFSKGITKIPLVKAEDVGLIEVSVNRGTSYIVVEGNRYFLSLDRPGKYKLDLEYLIKVKREREHGPGQFSFEVLPSPISEFEVIINDPDLEVFVEPSIKIETKKEKDKTIAWAIMPRTNNISVRWTKALTKEVITPVKLEPKIYSTVYTFTAAGEGLLRCQSRIDYSILQSEISEIRLLLPEDASVLEVTGANLRDWKVLKKDGYQYVDIYFKFGVKGNYSLDINYERPIGEGSVIAQIPPIKTVGIEREKGFIGIASATNVELRVSSAKDATVIDVRELPHTIWNRTSSPILLAFKYLNDAYDIQIEVIRHEEVPVLVAAIDLANYVTLNTDDGKSLTKALCHVRNNVKQFLRLELPEGATLWSASVSDKPVKPAKDKQGHILIPLEKSQLTGESLTQFPVEIVYLEKDSKMAPMGSLEMSLPKADIPTSELYWSVYLPKDYAYYKFTGDVKKTELIRPMVVPVGLSRDKKLKEGALAPQYRQQAFEQKTLDEATRKGALPIKVSVPEQGRVFRFSRILVAEDEGSALAVNYLSLSKGWIARILAIAIFALILVAILASIFKPKKLK